MIKSRNIILRVSIFGIYLILFCSYTTLAQEQPESTGSISGFVYDSETKEPLRSANIFLSKTTLGATSDQTGYFEIKDVPPGRFILVFRYIGYSQKSILLEMDGNENVHINDMQLDSQQVELDYIDVTSTRPVGWMRNYEYFQAAFLGRTQNASQTEIINPEVITFSTNPDNGNLTADASGELHVINNALGYELFITLDIFSWNRETDTGEFYFKARINELTPEREAQKQEWAESRARTFQGSFRHFLQLLVDKKAEDDFRLEYGSIEFIAEGKGRYAETFIFKVNSRGDRALNVQYGRRNQSEIEVSDNQWIYLDQYGNLINPENVAVSGYWASQRVADFLPFDYQNAEGE
ncbi:MAG: carboxypeptidase-like regulatory domain-containing protein [Balneolaceae bacterium]